jgi:hypothetical protein
MLLSEILCTFSSVTTRKLRSYGTSRYAKKFVRVRSENVCPSSKLTSSQLSLKARNSQHTYAKDRVMQTAFTCSSIALQPIRIKEIHLVAELTICFSLCCFLHLSSPFSSSSSFFSVTGVGARIDPSLSHPTIRLEVLF